jgi:alpha-L-arabinofuranosidase
MPSPDFGDVAMVDGAAILSDDHELHVYAVNRSVDDSVDLQINLSGGHLETLSAELLHHSDPTTQNTWENPNAVRRAPGEMSNGPQPVVRLPPHSFLAATLSVS